MQTPKAPVVPFAFGQPNAPDPKATTVLSKRRSSAREDTTHAVAFAFGEDSRPATTKRWMYHGDAGWVSFDEESSHKLDEAHLGRCVSSRSRARERTDSMCTD